MSSSPSQPYAQYDLSTGLKLGIGVLLPVFPRLMPADRPIAPQMLCRPLVSDPLAAQIPWTALAYLTQDSQFFVDIERIVRMEVDAALAVQEALANLKKRPAHWRLETFQGDADTTLTYALCDDDVLAAEHVLDKSFLLQATRLLHMPPQVAVAVPRRGLLVAVGLNSPNELLRQFKLQIQQWHAEAGDDALSPLFFRTVFGVPMSVVYFNGKTNL